MKTILLTIAIGITSIVMGQGRWITADWGSIYTDSIVMRKISTTDTIIGLVNYFGVKGDTVGTFEDSAIIIRVEKRGKAVCEDYAYNYSMWIPSRILLLSGQEIKLDQVIWKEEYYWDH